MSKSNVDNEHTVKINKNPMIKTVNSVRDQNVIKMRQINRDIASPQECL